MSYKDLMRVDRSVILVDLVATVVGNHGSKEASGRGKNRSADMARVVGGFSYQNQNQERKFMVGFQ